jgi:hypothetical protein
VRRTGGLTLWLRVVVRVDEATAKETRRLWAGLGPLPTTVCPHHRGSERRAVPESPVLPHRCLGRGKASQRELSHCSSQVVEPRRVGWGLGWQLAPDGSTPRPG